MRTAGPILAGALAAALASAPALAQEHVHAPGMTMPAEPAPEAPAPEASAPAAAAPAVAGGWLADRYYDPAAMAHARDMARHEMGGMRVSKVMLNLAEYQAAGQGGAYRWDGQAWFGGDIHRFVLRSQGEGSGRGGAEAGEVRALYSRAVSRYFDLQAGVRQDFAPSGRTYLTVGAQGLVPYWFDVDAALFLSSRGELLARAEGTYDLRLTQRAVLQPRAELNLAAQDVRQTRTGAGLSSAELGLRLRYEVRREFAPYVGVSWERRLGRSADFARAAGEDVETTRFVAGLRAWF